MRSERLFDRIRSIDIDHVTKRYGKVFAVRDVSLSVRGGELLSLIGPSGSGKTTTLRMVNRLIEPDAGAVRINGEDVRVHDPVALRRNTGYVIQQIGLFPHMTVAGNIGLVPRLEGMDPGSIKARVRDLLSLVDLPPEHFMDRYPSELSGGQQQRVGLARALAMDPPLLLMDEPFGALDPLLRVQLQQEFSSIKEELGKTIIFVTHDIEESFALGDRIGIMRDASLVQVGTPQDLLFSPASSFVEDIVGGSRKLRHLEHVTVRDVMVPLGAGAMLDSAMGASDALAHMERLDLDTAAVSGRSFPGMVRLIDLYRAPTDATLEDVLRNVPVFSPGDALEPALRTLRDAGLAAGLVMEHDTVTGVVCMDCMVLELLS
jgi:osmoprotectant transport system ATP-binding protein